MLANMGFDQNMMYKRLDKLSLGERTRVKLAKLILDDKNLLVLDEPTNHLDLNSREQLENTLLEFGGTMLIVSHDRYFLEKICEKLLVFEDSKIRKLEIGFKSYMENKKSNIDSENKKNIEEELMVIENRMSYILGRLSKISQEDKESYDLDAEFKQLVEKRKRLNY